MGKIFLTGVGAPAAKPGVTSQYIFIRYSAYADGTDFTETWSAGQNYIGQATGSEAPTEKEAYVWSLFASNIRETLTVTLLHNNWANNQQEIDVAALGNKGAVFPSPSAESREEYLAAGVFLAVAEEGKLIFECEEVPTIDLFVDIQITEPLTNIGGACGAFSWNDLTDKPFEEQEVTIRIDWDGSTEGKTVIGAAVKVSDETPTIEELIGGTFIMSDGQTGLLNEEMVYEDQGLLFIGDTGVIIHTTTELEGLVFEPGTWYLYQESAVYIQSISFTRNVVKTLDPKYVDYSWSHITDKPFYDLGSLDPVLWDGVIGDKPGFKMPEGPDFTLITTTAYSAEDLKTATVVLTDKETGQETEYPIIAVEEQPGDGYTELYGIINHDTYVAVYVYLSNDELRGTLFASTDLTWYIGVTPYYVSALKFKSKVKTLDEKYLPSTIARCGETMEETEIVSNYTAEEYNNGILPACKFVVGESYTVIWEGVRYDNIVCQLDGDFRYLGGEGYPFYIDDNGGNSIYIDPSSFEGPLTIIGKALVIKQLDKKYLPEHKHSWKDLTNKPFIETPGDETITWDGNGNDSNPQFPYPEASWFYKVSDKIFTIEDLPTLSFTVYNNGDDTNYSITEIVEPYIADDGTMFIIGLEVGMLAAVLPEGNEGGYPAGTYFHVRVAFGSWYTSSMTFPGLVETIDEKVIPNTIARVEAVPHPDWNQEDETSVDYIKNKPLVTRDSIVLIDVGNGFSYTIQMINGNLVSYCETEKIEVATLPNKTVYKQGEKFDPTGMVVMIVGYDGSKREAVDFTYPTDWLMETGENVAVEITYQESEKVFKANVVITVTPFDPEIELIDFDYTANDDGTYILTGWKGTYNGNSSTEMIIPENPLVIL